jgi:GMP reductase
MSLYQDIALIPRFFKGKSRSDLDVSCDFLGKRFKLPVVPANMSSVINEDIAKYLSFNGYFYIMHRFFAEKDGNLKLLRKMNAELWPLTSISVGVQQSDKELVKQIAKEKLTLDYITVDIAHGHSKLMKNIISIIKSELPSVKIIAGNVCSPQGAADLISWGADCIKIGIAQGGACSTYGKTGFGLPMPETIASVYQKCEKDRFPVIIDGGIRTNGDIAKALVIGYSAKALIKDDSDFKSSLPELMVMAGSLFAACSDSPAETTSSGAKLYYGSASAKQKGHNKNVEGFEVNISENNMTYKEKLKEIEQDLQSAVSYAGGTCIEDFCNVEYFVK